ASSCSTTTGLDYGLTNAPKLLHPAADHNVCGANGAGNGTSTCYPETQGGAGTGSPLSAQFGYALSAARLRKNGTDAQYACHDLIVGAPGYASSRGAIYLFNCNKDFYPSGATGRSKAFDSNAIDFFQQPNTKHVTVAGDRYGCALARGFLDEA